MCANREAADPATTSLREAMTTMKMKMKKRVMWFEKRDPRWRAEDSLSDSGFNNVQVQKKDHERRVHMMMKPES
jgi:hypothetical protein